MMFQRIRCIRATVGILLIAGFSSHAVAERTVGQHIDDSTLSTAVKYQLARADGVPFGSINVEVHKGTAQLSGFIHKQTQKDAALAAAAQANGAARIEDALVLTEVPRTLGHFVDDQTIQARLKARIGEVLGISTAVAVVTHVRNGEVIVAGFVDSADTRYAVVEAARNITGVERVYNKLLLHR